MKCVATMLSAVLVLGLAGIATEASAGGKGYGNRDCYKCPPRRNYHSAEVIKTTRNVDHSRTIKTRSVVPSRRVVETNHLVIRENQTRNIGVVRHNHTIIEKQLVLRKRNVDVKHVNTVVNLVKHKYNTVRRRVVEVRDIPGEYRVLRDCNCGHRRYPGEGLSVYGKANKSINAYVRAPKYVNTRY